MDYHDIWVLGEECTDVLFQFIFHSIKMFSTIQKVIIEIICVEQ